MLVRMVSFLIWKSTFLIHRFLYFNIHFMNNNSTFYKSFDLEKYLLYYMKIRHGLGEDLRQTRSCHSASLTGGTANSPPLLQQSPHFPPSSSPLATHTVFSRPSLLPFLFWCPNSCEDWLILNLLVHKE